MESQYLGTAAKAVFGEGVTGFFFLALQFLKCLWGKTF